jgi:cation transport ATPase
VPLTYWIPEMDSERLVQEVIQRTERVPGVQQVTVHRATQRLSLELDETCTTRGVLENLLIMWGYSPKLWNDARWTPQIYANHSQATNRKADFSSLKRWNDLIDRRAWLTVVLWAIAGVLGIVAANLLEGWVQIVLSHSALAPWWHALESSVPAERHSPDLLLLVGVMGVMWGCASIHSVLLRRSVSRRLLTRKPGR